MTSTKALFSDPAADIVLRSSDGTDFRVFKFYLSRTSPVFRSMLANSKTMPFGYLDETTPIIQLTEDQKTLTNLLSLCCVGETPFPPLDTLDEVSKVLEAAKKYELRSATHYALEKLEKFIGLKPGQDCVRVYTLACIYGSRKIAKKAAEGALRIPHKTFIESKPPELKYSTGEAYYALVKYRLDCVEAVTACTTAPKNFQGDYVFTNSHMTEEGYYGKECGLEDRDGLKIKWWFRVEMTRLSDALRSRPCVEPIEASSFALDVYTRYVFNCTTCKKVAARDLLRFANNLRKVIQEAQSKVQLDLSHITDIMAEKDTQSQVDGGSKSEKV